MKLIDRRLVVTGGASGIGRATVEAILREGAHVAILDINIDNAGMQEFQAPQRCWQIACDVREAASEARGVVALSKTMSIELAPKIRVNAVCPRTTLTPMVDKVRLESQDAINRMLAAVPKGRLAETEEIVDLIVLLTGRESSFLTGTAIAADGVRTRH